MLTKQDKTNLRGELFRHLDGIVSAPVAYALVKRKVTDYLLKKGTVKLSDAAGEFNANEGYLNIGLRVLSAQGWLDQEIDNASGDVSYSTNGKSEKAFALFPKYESIVRFMDCTDEFKAKRFQSEPFNQLRSIQRELTSGKLFDKPSDNISHELQEQMIKHIEGILVGPTAVALGMSGMFHKYFMETSFRPEEFHRDHENFKILLDLYTFLGWFKEKNGTYRFTDKGLFFAKRASAYGVTVSYIPTFRRVEELIFGNPKVLWEKPDNADELHVDREMNVWGSGGAHSTYFKKIDEVIIDLFNKPIHQQPKGIVDMGCGNGAFLEHIFNVIERQTKRGEMLEEHPLFLVGADFNQAALRVTRANLIQADIWAKVIWGDIGRPDILAKDLEEDYGIQLEDLLNVRTFLDHNRVWD
ncbi:MAG: class I SAM-dependent methyltransferase, partial [Bacteroidota bacterium]